MSEELEFGVSFPAPGVSLCGMTWDGACLWHSDASTDRLYCLDPGTGDVLKELECDEVRTDLAFDGKFLWQIAGKPKRIRLIRPEDGQVEGEMELGAHAESACGLLVAGDQYWVGYKVEAMIEERKLPGRRLLRTYSTLPHVDGLALVEGVLYYTSFSAGLLVGLDAGSGREIAQYRLAGNPTGMCWDGIRFWYSDYTNRRIRSVRILPEGEAAAAEDGPDREGGAEDRAR